MSKGKHNATLVISTVSMLSLVLLAQGHTTVQRCPYRPDGSCIEVLDEHGRVIETQQRAPYDPEKLEIHPDPVNSKPTPAHYR